MIARLINPSQKSAHAFPTNVPRLPARASIAGRAVPVSCTTSPPSTRPLARDAYSANPTAYHLLNAVSPLSGNSTFPITHADCRTRAGANTQQLSQWSPKSSSGPASVRANTRLRGSRENETTPTNTSLSQASPSVYGSSASRCAPSSTARASSPTPSTASSAPASATGSRAWRTTRCATSARPATD